MRALALKGGAATKRRFQNDAAYYRSLGALGGRASVAARKARLAAGEARLSALPSDVPTQAEPAAPLPVATPVTPYRPSEWVRKHLAMARSRTRPTATASTLADRLAEELIAQQLAQTCCEGNDELEPFDPWH